MGVPVRRDESGRIVGGRKITQVRPGAEAQAERAAAGEKGKAQARRRDHSPKRKMKIVDRYEWRPIGADSGSHAVKLTLECGCIVQRWKSQEPKLTARCEHRAR